MLKLFSEIDLATYARGVQFASSISRLYSNSDTPLIDSRFTEKLFCEITGALDLSRSDMSFDAIYDHTAGVGVKTFVATARSAFKFEKVAEFTRLGVTLSGLSAKELVFEISRLRNLRIQSDSAQFAIDLRRSFYHCLIRLPGSVFVHEEPYELIDARNLVLLASSPNSVSFTDGKNDYRFSRSKSVLFKKFELLSGKNSPEIEAPLSDGLWGQILGQGFLLSELTSQNPKPVIQSEPRTDELEPLQDGDFVVLPLYSFSKGRGKFVPERSGVNQWNANGRKRKFGEAYIPVPKIIHDLRPGFFPPRDQKFRLRLPDGSTVSSKICQDGGKALMSDPNEKLCRWLFAALDGSFEVASERFEQSKSYEYTDLESIGRDAVKVSRINDTGLDYVLELVEIDSFEDFLEVTKEAKNDN